MRIAQCRNAVDRNFIYYKSVLRIRIRMDPYPE